MTLYVALDGEMSAADVWDGGRLIQIGLAMTPLDTTPGTLPDTFTSLINPGEYTWSERAAAVHGFTQDDITAAPTAATVDTLATEWLINHGADPAHRSTIAIGFNVGAFDLPHLTRVLPNTARLLSRRTIDLNALCFTLEGVPYQGSIPKWAGWKRLATLYAERTLTDLLPADAAAHDAGYDALLHAYAWEFLRAAIHGTPLTPGQTPVNHTSRQIRTLTGALLAKHGAVVASEMTGLPVPLLIGWAAGGRVTHPDAQTIIETALNTQPSPQTL